MTEKDDDAAHQAFILAVHRASQIEPLLPRCGTCAFWRECEGNANLGTCAKLGGLVYGDQLSINDRGYVESHVSPVSDFAAVRAGRDFGCVRHSEYHPIAGKLHKEREEKDVQ